MKIYLKQKNRGFTLVETLVAISIFTVSLLGLISILASGISDTGYAKKKMAAAYLAQEGIEYVRNKRDTDVISPVGWGHFRDIPAPFSEIIPPLPSDNSFNRTIQKEIIDQNEVKISSTVSWIQGSGSYSITFSENLFNWVE